MPDDIPAGFRRYESASRIMQLLGELHVRDEADGAMTLTFRLDDIHLNFRGVAHGGVLATIADSLLGVLAAKACGHPVATAHLSADYFGRADRGEWLTFRAHVNKTGRRMTFVECSAAVGDRPVFRATGVFATILASGEPAAAAG